MPLRQSKHRDASDGFMARRSRHLSSFNPKSLAPGKLLATIDPAV
jgi:hypothetical protein